MEFMMRNKIYIMIILMASSQSLYADRIKDLADVAGVRSNQLVGYGLVAGLSGTGDGKDPVSYTHLRAHET